MPVGLAEGLAEDNCRRELLTLRDPAPPAGKTVRLFARGAGAADRIEFRWGGTSGGD